MIKWPSAMYVKPGTTNTAWTFLTMFLKKKMSPGSVNHVPQCETLPNILLYIVYPGVATCIIILFFSQCYFSSYLCFLEWALQLNKPDTGKVYAVVGSTFLEFCFGVKKWF